MLVNYNQNLPVSPGSLMSKPSISVLIINPDLPIRCGGQVFSTNSSYNFVDWSPSISKNSSLSLNSSQPYHRPSMWWPSPDLTLMQLRYFTNPWEKTTKSPGGRNPPLVKLAPEISSLFSRSPIFWTRLRSRRPPFLLTIMLSFVFVKNKNKDRDTTTTNAHFWR